MIKFSFFLFSLVFLFSGNFICQNADISQNYASQSFADGKYKFFTSNNSSNAYEDGSVEIVKTVDSKLGVTQIKVNSMTYNSHWITKGSDTIFYAPYYVSENYSAQLVCQGNRLLIFNLMADKSLGKLRNIIGKNTGKVGSVYDELEEYLVEANAKNEEYKGSFDDRVALNKQLLSGEVYASNITTSGSPSDESSGKSKFELLKEKAKEKSDALKASLDQEKSSNEDSKGSSSSKSKGEKAVIEAKKNDPELKEKAKKESEKFNISELKADKIKSIEIEYMGYEYEAISKRELPGYIVTMKDGTVHKSTSLGGKMSTYNELKIDRFEVSENYGVLYFDFHVKENPSIKATIEHKIESYPYDIKNNYFGSTSHSNGEKGDNGPDVYLYAKKITNEHGMDLIKLKEVVKGKETIYILNMDLTIQIASQGGSGANGNKGSRSESANVYSGNGGAGGDGGSGGNVYITLDPNVTGKQKERFKFGTYILNGGYGGDGGQFGTCSDCKGKGKFGAKGSLGEDGKMTITVKEVKF